MKIFGNVPQILKSAYLERDFAFMVFCLMLLFLPLSINLSSFLLIVAIGLKLLQVFILKQPLFIVKALKYSSIIGLVFFIYILSSSVVQTGFSHTFEYFGKQFSRWELLFLIPILLRSSKDNLALCYFFFSGILICIVYVYIMVFIYEMDFDNLAFQGIVDIHHTYLCIFLLFFVNFLFMRYAHYKNDNGWLGIFCGLFIMLSFFMIFILESKISIVIFCILTLYHLVPSISKRNAIGYSLLLTALIFSLFFFNKRIKVSYDHALDFRLEIWNESIKLIEENPFIGSLKDSEKDLLNYRHYVSGKYYFMDSDLNSHNQYFSILIKHGFVGGIILSLFAVLVFKTINKNTTQSTLKEFFGLTIIVLMVFYVENILDRHHAIVFCTVFYNYFLINVQNENV